LLWLGKVVKKGLFRLIWVDIWVECRAVLLVGLAADAENMRRLAIQSTSLSNQYKFILYTRFLFLHYLPDGLYLLLAFRYFFDSKILKKPR
jgi:hypothetical protein